MYETALLLGTMLSIAVFVVFARAPSFSVFHPLFFYSAFHFLVFVIRPIFGQIYGYQLIYHLYEFRPDLSVRLTAYAVAQHIAGLLGLRIEELWPERYIFKPRQRQSHKEELP